MDLPWGLTTTSDHISFNALLLEETAAKTNDAPADSTKLKPTRRFTGSSWGCLSLTSEHWRSEHSNALSSPSDKKEVGVKEQRKRNRRRRTRTRKGGDNNNNKPRGFDTGMASTKSTRSRRRRRGDGSISRDSAHSKSSWGSLDVLELLERKQQQQHEEGTSNRKGESLDSVHTKSSWAGLDLLEMIELEEKKDKGNSENCSFEADSYNDEESFGCDSTVVTHLDMTRSTHCDAGNGRSDENDIGGSIRSAYSQREQSDYCFMLDFDLDELSDSDSEYSSDSGSFESEESYTGSENESDSEAGLDA